MAREAGSRQLSLVVDQYDAVAGFAGAEVVEGVVHFGHGELLGDGGDVVPRAEFEHLVDDDGTAGGRAADGFLARDEAEGRNFQWLEHGADVVEVALWPERVEQGGDIERGVDGGDDQVEAAGDLLEGVRVFCVVDEVGAELLASASLLSLVVKA